MALVSNASAHGTTPEVVRSGRARGIAAAISAGFAVSWLSWGTAALAPGLFLTVLRVGSGLAVLVAAVGIVLAVRSPGDSTPMRDPAVARRYGVIVGVEFAMIFAGLIVVANTVGAEWVPVWVCAGVGLHFIPLSKVFGETSLMILAGLITTSAAMALFVGLTSDVAPVTITGTGAGLSLLVSAVVTLVADGFYTGRPAETH